MQYGAASRFQATTYLVIENLEISERSTAWHHGGAFRNKQRELEFTPIKGKKLYIAEVQRNGGVFIRLEKHHQWNVLEDQVNSRADSQWWKIKWICPSYSSHVLWTCWQRKQSYSQLPVNNLNPPQNTPNWKRLVHTQFFTFSFLVNILTLWFLTLSSEQQLKMDWIKWTIMVHQTRPRLVCTQENGKMLLCD